MCHPQVCWHSVDSLSSRGIWQLQKRGLTKAGPSSAIAVEGSWPFTSELFSRGWRFCGVRDTGSEYVSLWMLHVYRVQPRMWLCLDPGSDLYLTVAVLVAGGSPGPCRQLAVPQAAPSQAPTINRQTTTCVVLQGRELIAPNKTEKEKQNKQKTSKE